MTTQKNDKLGLSVREAGWLLQKPESRIRGMLRRGELAYAVEGRKIDPVSVRRLLEGDYAGLVLDMLLSEDVTAPMPQQRYAAPAPLYPGVLEFAPATGFLARHGDVESEGCDGMPRRTRSTPSTDNRTTSTVFARSPNNVRKDHNQY